MSAQSRARGRDCSGGFVDILRREVLAGHNMMPGGGGVGADGKEGPGTAPPQFVVAPPFGPMRPPETARAPIYPVSESAVVRRLLTDQASAFSLRAWAACPSPALFFLFSSGDGGGLCVRAIMTTRGCIALAYPNHIYIHTNRRHAMSSTDTSGARTSSCAFLAHQASRKIVSFPFPSLSWIDSQLLPVLSRHASCNERMGEMFVTTAQLKAIHQQLGGVLSGFLWCS